MKIEQEQRGRYLLIRAEGRLDASWADYFTDTLLLHIRNGRHNLVIDASKMIFLSSAGIRALLRVFKELKTVRGSFLVVNPTPFVEQTLSTSGFQMWLGEGPPEDMPAAGSGGRENEAETDGMHHFVLNETASLTLSEEAVWHPWQRVDARAVTTLTCSPDICAFGIGSSAPTFEEARDRFGEFLSVAGNVAYQPPDEQGHPDYLVSERQFVPRMQCIQLLSCRGEMGHLIRFAPTAKTSFFPISALVEKMLETTQEKAAGFVMLGEIEGLVGTALIRSPGLLDQSQDVPFPEIRDWLTFCGERLYSHQQALILGIAGRSEGMGERTLCPPLPSCSGVSAHIHAAVFPYQPLQNGKIEWGPAVNKFFSGPPPLAVMHLADDARPVVGLGQSALSRGACWFGPIHNLEVLS